MLTVPEKLVKIKILTLFLLLLLRGSSYPMEVSLKITGSLSYFYPDHINRSLHGREEYLIKSALREESTTYKEGEVKDVHFATSFEGEFLLSLTSRLSLGIGTGYIYAEATEEETGITMERPEDILFSVHPTKINAYPLNLCGYYFLPLSNKLKTYMRAGLGFIWAEYIERIGIWFKPDENYTEIIHQKASARGPSYFSGIGLIYEAYPDIHFFMEAEAKLAKLSHFQVGEQQEEKQTLYFYEQYDSDLDFWQAKNILHKEKPSGNDLRAVEESVVALSGFSVKLGITIKF